MDAGGTELYTESQTVTPDSDGLYNVNIGAVTSLSGVSFNQDLWLSVSVNGELLPGRYRLTASPYALQASTAGVASSVAWTGVTGVPSGFADGVDDLGAGSPTVEEGDAPVAPSSILDFLGGHFDVSAGPVGEANISLDASSVTLMGNSFNGNDQLVRLNSSGQLPALSAANLTGLPAASLTGTVPNASLDGSSVTKAGNAFNGVSQLVRLNSSGELPALSAVNLTNLPAAALSGTVPGASLDSSSVTKMGNSFNAASQLVQLNSSGQLPALSGANLTALPAANLSGTVPNASLDASSVTKVGPTVDWSELNGVPAGFSDGTDDTTPGSDAVASSQILDGGIAAADLGGNSVTSSKILNDEIVNADINSAAAIAYSKLNLAGGIVNADVSGSAAIAYSKLSLAGGIVNADISGSAAIGYSKLNLSGSVLNADLTSGSVGAAQIIDSTITASDLASDSVTSLKILNDEIVNADINSAAAIAYSKLNLAGGIVNADVSGSAAIAYSKLNLAASLALADMAAGSVGGSQIIDSTVALSDLNTSDVDLHYVTTGTAQTINAAKTFNANITMGSGNTVDGVDISAHDAAATGVHGVGSGQIVGTDLTQTLTNKTLGAVTLSGTLTGSGSPALTGLGSLTQDSGSITASLSSTTVNGTLTLSGSGAGATVGGHRVGMIEGATETNNVLFQYSSATVNGSLTIDFTDSGLKDYAAAPFVVVTPVFNSDGNTALDCNPHTVSATGMTIECVLTTGDGLGGSVAADGANRQVNYVLMGPAP